MKKFFSLLKGIMSQDMNIFIYKTKNKEAGIRKLIVPMVLSLILMFYIGSMFFGLAEALKDSGNLFIILTFVLLLPSALEFMEGIYKSQGILFEAKDTELLFSLPISKKAVVLARLIKLYVFQLLYGTLFTVPGLVVYAIFTNPSAYYYVISITVLLLLPIIPTISGGLIGYAIKRISVRFKAKKAIETVITFLFLMLIFAASFLSQGLVASINENAFTIDATVKYYYYPIKAISELFDGFNLLTFLFLLLINVALVAVFVWFVGRTYFNTYSKSNDKVKSKDTLNLQEYKFKKSPVLRALIKKEFKRLTSSTVYMINTLFGLLLLIVATIGLSMNFRESLTLVSEGEVTEEEISFLYTLAPKMFLAILVGVSFLTSITSSSISLEGKSFAISKSLPVKVEKFLMAKVLMSDCITVPVMVICSIIFCSQFSVSLLEIIALFLTCFIAPSISAVFGLITNLKFPNMNASSDAEVVKQSTSSMVAIIGGILASVVIGGIIISLGSFGDIFMLLGVLGLAIILCILCLILFSYGKKRYREIEI